MIIKPGNFLWNTTREPNGDLYRFKAEAFAITYKQVRGFAAHQQ
jgi:hypothetical protein